MEQLHSQLNSSLEQARAQHCEEMEKAWVLHLEKLERARNQRADEVAGLQTLAETLGGQLEEAGVALERALLEANI